MTTARCLTFVLALGVPHFTARAEGGGAAAAGPAAMDRAALRAWADAAETELRNDILPFWLEHTRDRERGGFFGEISNGNAVKKDAPRGALLTSRILWTFSAAYRRYHEPEYLEMARWAYTDLVTRFRDEEQGGLFWTVTADGRPLDTRKQIYGQVFGVYSLAEFFRATGEQEALDRAVEIYRLIEKHARDREHGGYFEAFSREWQRRDDLQRSAMGGSAPKSQNTHLHIMEAYTNLLRAWPDPQLRRDHAALIELMMTRVVNPANRHLHLFLAADWAPRSDDISYGHDIEFSWLLPEAAAVQGDAALLARARALALDVARTTLAEGLDADGGMFNEAGPHGLTDTGKDWWPQAEAAVGFVNAAELSGDAQFLRAGRRSWDFIEARLIDRKNGEWFWGVTREGKVRGRMMKVGLWKCPYHNGRACLELVERLRALAGEEAAAAGS